MVYYFLNKDPGTQILEELAEFFELELREKDNFSVEWFGKPFNKPEIYVAVGYDPNNQKTPIVISTSLPHSIDQGVKNMLQFYFSMCAPTQVATVSGQIYDLEDF
jgi:hypothetical protein